MAFARPSPGCTDLPPKGFNRVTQSVIVGLKSRDLAFHYLQSMAQLGVLLALRRDLLLLFLNRLDDGRQQFAVGNAIGTILVVLPFNQRQPMLGFRFLDGVVQRCRQRLFEVLRNKAVAQGLIAVVETVGYRLELFDEIEAEIGMEWRDVLLAPPVRNGGDRRDFGVDLADETVPKNDRVGGSEQRAVAERSPIRIYPCISVRTQADERIGPSCRVCVPGIESDSGVVVAAGVEERVSAAGGVTAALSVAQKGPLAKGGIVGSRVVGEGVGAARRVSLGIVEEWNLILGPAEDKARLVRERLRGCR